MPLATSKDPPPGYVTVRQALDTDAYRIVNIVGVVVDFMPPAQSKGPDMQVTFVVCDTSVPHAVHAGIKIKWFYNPRDTKNRPQINGVGDLVIVQSVKVREFGLDKVAISTHSAGCIVFSGKKIPLPHFNDEVASGARPLPHESTHRARAPTEAEQLYVIDLHHRLQAVTTQAFVSSSTTQYKSQMPPPPSLPPSQKIAASTPMSFSKRNKFRLLKDCEDSGWYDLVVEVVKIYPLGHDRCEIYVTDYTENPQLYDYNKNKGGMDGDPFNYTDTGRTNWQGPMGKRTIQILLYEPHASACVRGINERDLVFMRNIHLKQDNIGSKIEGVLHFDPKYPDRIDIFKPRVSDDRMMSLQKRRDEYWESVGKADTDGPKMNRNQRKKMEKESMKRKRKEEEEEQKQKKARENAKEISGHVVTERPVTTPARVADILDNAHYKHTTASGVVYQAPFINAKFRTQVRVIDYLPDKLEDFAQSLDDPAYNDMPLGTQSAEASSDEKGRWEWAFFLIVEDAQQPQPSDNNTTSAEHPPRRMEILVSGSDAEYLLNLSASDLRNDRATLSQLKEKLFVLWGNLQELKAEGLDPWDDTTRKKHDCLPFECFVKQYGVEDASEPLGYRRMFRMFGTNIK